jgi:hypothetical protein
MSSTRPTARSAADKEEIPLAGVIPGRWPLHPVVRTRSAKARVTGDSGTAPPESRAEVLAGYFLGAYIGLSVPVIGLGIATEYVPARDVMLGFAAVAVAAIALSAWAVIRSAERQATGATRAG